TQSRMLKNPLLQAVLLFFLSISELLSQYTTVPAACFARCGNLTTTRQQHNKQNFALSVSSHTRTALTRTSQIL
ncbi:MAG: hypothetical protein KAX25_02030, partial [Dehalococcoidia bacterium]|nr:hypothetical protein [Dehalococcoidia bacterium]